LDHTELVKVKARSQNEMKKTLNWWDLMWFGIGAVIGVGIFVLTGLKARGFALRLLLHRIRRGDLM
jgi:APA family basic amino acid/polyamine antiporter